MWVVGGVFGNIGVEQIFVEIVSSPLSSILDHTEAYTPAAILGATEGKMATLVP